MIQPGLDFQTTPEVRQMLSQLGRTEDLRLSPSRHLLAITGFCSDRLIVFKLDIEVSAGLPKIQITDFVQFTSAALSHPHGIAFFDEQTVAIANRTGKVSFFRIPPMGGERKFFNLKPLRILRGNLVNKLHSPGSLDAYGIGENQFRLLICNNYVHVVTEARISLNGSLKVRKHRLLLQKSLDIPDGICVSADRQWLVISNHMTHSLFVYENKPGLGIDSDPVTELRGMKFPHGVRFAAEDRYIIVVDSGDPTLCVYARGRDGWRGVHQPARVIRVLDEATFQLGRYNEEEGGPKGLDIDERSGVLAMTCEHQPLVFYPLGSLLPNAAEAPAP